MEAKMRGKLKLYRTFNQQEEQKTNQQSQGAVIKGAGEQVGRSRKEDWAQARRRMDGLCFR
jgi:hypothetical protein